VLDDLLRIKTLRERTAEIELSRCRNVLKEAENRLERACADLDEFRAYSISEEKATYAKLFGRLVTLADIDDVRARVAELRAGVQDREKQVEQEEKARDEASDAVSAAEEMYVGAVRDCDKLKEVIGKMEQEMRVELQRGEDLELEEVRTQGTTSACGGDIEQAVGEGHCA
jgi:chromosome segregation ATPase